MSTFFKAKTQEGYTIKILAELLQHNIKTACFKINKDGIFLRMMDSHRKILINLELHNENFSIYKFRGDEDMFLGINLNHFYKMLKSIKKKDSIMLFINDDSKNNLGIQVIPRENNRVTTSYIKIQKIQNIEIPLPENYDKPIIVPSNEYQKMCKDMVHIGNIITVISKDFHIKFLCNTGSIYSREVVFGEIEEEEMNQHDDIKYEKDFDTDQLSRIVKIAGLSNTIQVYTKEGEPIFFKSNAGGLGKIFIYIKSKDQIEMEEHKIANLDSN